MDESRKAGHFQLGGLLFAAADQMLHIIWNILILTWILDVQRLFETNPLQSNNSVRNSSYEYYE